MATPAGQGCRADTPQKRSDEEDWRMSRGKPIRSGNQQDRLTEPNKETASSETVLYFLHLNQDLIFMTFIYSFKHII